MTTPTPTFLDQVRAWLAGLTNEQRRDTRAALEEFEAEATGPTEEDRRQFRAAVMSSIQLVAKKNDLFTADDVWECVERTTYFTMYLPEHVDRRTVGSLLNAAKRKGWCRPATTLPPHRTRRQGGHRGTRTQWVSLLREGAVGRVEGSYPPQPPEVQS